MKHIIFDLGKVLVDYDFQPLYNELGYIPAADFIMDSTDKVLEFEAGRISSVEFYSSMKNIYKFDHNIDEFREVWCSVFTGLTELVDFAEKLSAKYNVYVLSNTDEWHFNSIWQQYPELHFFKDKLMLSYQLEAVKPHEEIFNKALVLFDLKPEDCLFIDDRQENITGANLVGMKGILFNNALETKNKIKKMIDESEEKDK